jgi:methionyl aminopeptidase
MQYSPKPDPAAALAEAAGRVLIKGPAEQDAMRVAGRLAAGVLDMIGPRVVPGITTDELNQVCHDFIVGEQQAVPAPLGYCGFPK